MNQTIMKQIGSGTIPNPFLSHSKTPWRSHESQRVMHMLLYMRTGLANPKKPDQHITHLEDVKHAPLSRQQRYFGAWSLDQWDHAADKLRKMGHDESEVMTYKEDFLTLLHNDFKSGLAYEYADDWYQSFPKGGFFNPMRYSNLYKDEMAVSHAIEEHLQCELYQPAIKEFMTHQSKTQFNHNFLKNAGGIVINYPNKFQNIPSLINSNVDEMDAYVSEMIGEEEDGKHKQRIFVTPSADVNCDMSQCAVYYHGFDTQEQNVLMTSVRNAITETIPTDYFRDYRLSISTDSVKVTFGQIDLCEKYLAKEPKKEPVFLKTESVDISAYNHFYELDEEDFFRPKANNTAISL